MKLQFEKVMLISLARLTNAEFIFFVSRFIELLEALQEKGTTGGDESLPEVQAAAVDGVPALYITQDVMDDVKADIEKMVELNKQSRSRIATKKLTELDQQRDRLAAYISSVVARAAELPDEEDRELGMALYNDLKVYAGIGKMPQNDETVTIRGMINDIRKPQHATAVATFGIEKYVNQLEEVNESYAQMALQRSMEISETKLQEKNKELRARLGSLYDAMLAHAFAANLLHGTDDTERFIHDWNSFVEEIKANRNLRGSSKKEDDDDEEGTTEEPDDKPVVS